MVDALTECWRVLEPGGILVDLRPVHSNPALEILVGEAAYVSGRIQDADGEPDDIAAHEAMAEVVRRGCFALEKQETFEYGDYWESLEGMLAYAADRWRDFVFIPPAVIQSARRTIDGQISPYRIRIRRTMHIAVYCKREPIE